MTLIDAMFALTPQERIEQNDRMLQMIAELRDGLADREDTASRHVAAGRVVGGSEGGDAVVRGEI